MADQTQAEPKPAARKLLIVDDDQDILDSLRTMFEEHGYAVVTATDGNAALAQAESHNPDLVVLDMMLPKRSGFLVLEKLKSKKREHHPKVIMITGNEGLRHQTYAEALGVDDYIKKPFRLERLLKRVQDLIG